MKDDSQTAQEESEELEPQEVIDEEKELLKQQAEEYKNKYLRALADYQNLSRRAVSDRQELIDEGKKMVVNRFLPFIDNLEKAELFIKDPGLKLIKDQFSQALKQLGVEEIELLGKEYDPATAEAVEVVEGEEDDTITEVLQKGYTMNGKLLRHAQVKVAKKR